MVKKNIWLVKYSLILLLLIVSASAFSSSWVLSWQRPVLREDGSDLLFADIDHYMLYCGTRSGDYTEQAQINRTLLSTPLPAAIDYKTKTYCVMTTVDTGGRESAYSNEKMIDLTPTQKVLPKTPTNIRIIF